ncbi:MAG: hypothetical protein JRN21_04115 [Nitrososphaerota archaeon]|nr:hypothetical protein [Nitrososphaerota archaeon]
MKALVSLMCHPEREPKIQLPPDGRYDAFVNRIPNYAEAYRAAIARAMDEGADLVTADTDGYHPPGEIAKLAAGDFGEGPVLVIPYRENIGIQSRSFSLFFSLIGRRRVRDATGGLCRLSLDFMRSLPPLRSDDMTVHIEILRHAAKSGAKLVQYGYLASSNDEAESRRTAHYQLRLIWAALK